MAPFAADPMFPWEGNREPLDGSANPTDSCAHVSEILDPPLVRYVRLCELCGGPTRSTGTTGYYRCAADPSCGPLRESQTMMQGASPMRMREFIRENRSEIDRAVRAAGGPRLANDAERRDWILNEEGLYQWARSSGVPV